MLAFDSLVIDLIFQERAELDPDAMLSALGGVEVTSERKIIDVDMQDPRFEMEVSPSIPFRRRGERRLLIVDDRAPLRENPETDPVVPVDLRPEKERLIAVCEVSPIRVGRISSLGSFADAVIVARSARDLRGVALLPWVLDPTIDVDGKRRATPLGKAEFQTKIDAYHKRLEEIDDQEILADLGPATLTRRGDYLVVDVLEADGTWDLRKSFQLEAALSAIERFSLIPGAPAQPRGAAPEPAPGASRRPAAGAAPKAKPAPKPEPKPEPEPEPDLPPPPPIDTAELGDRLVLVFPPDRFEPATAAALGKKDYEGLLQPTDHVPGPLRDRIYRDGAGFVAPLEFFSEVFVDGTPLSRPQFDQSANVVAGDARALEVHCPRYGTAILVDVPGRGRFLSSEVGSPEAVVDLVRGLS